MFLKRARLKNQLDDWSARGLLTAEQADALRVDVDNRPPISFGYIAAMLGAICICFAAMTFVAANWNEMSRLVRMGVLLGGGTAAYVAAGLLAARGKPKFAQAFVILGCGIFGATIMFVSQMYHLTGRPEDGVLLWCLGTLAAAIFLRSVPAACLGLMLATLWAGMHMSRWEEVYFWYLPLWCVFAALAWYWRNRTLAHLCALGLVMWQFFALYQAVGESSMPVGMALSLVGIALVLGSGSVRRWLQGFGYDAIAYFVLAFYGWGVIWWVDNDTAMVALLGSLGLAAIPAGLAFARPAARLDTGMCAVWIVLSVFAVWLEDLPYLTEAVGLGVTIWTIRMGRRIEKPPVSWLGYIGFAATMLAIYFEAAEGLLSTSAFYFGAGLLLLTGTWLAPKIASALPWGAES